MDDWRIEGVAVRAGIEDAVSGVGEEVDEGVGKDKDYWQFLINIINIRNLY